MAREEEEVGGEGRRAVEPRRTTLERPSRAAPPRRERFGASAPVSLMRRLSEDVDRLFDSLFGSRTGTGEGRWQGLFGESAWAPEIEAFERDGKLVVRADLPGVEPEDVEVELRDDALVISGERRADREREEGRAYMRELRYGRFYRSIPLPQGVPAESATATYLNGVLTVEIEAPRESRTRGRRIEVREGRPH